MRVVTLGVARLLIRYGCDQYHAFMFIACVQVVEPSHGLLEYLGLSIWLDHLKHIPSCTVIDTWYFSFTLARDRMFTIPSR